MAIASHLVSLPTAPDPTTGSSARQVAVGRLQQRADSLRSLAQSVDPILATSYRRRASELELEVWVHVVRSGISPDDSPLAA